MRPSSPGSFSQRQFSVFYLLPPLLMTDEAKTGITCKIPTHQRRRMPCTVVYATVIIRNEIYALTESMGFFSDWGPGVGVKRS